MSKGILLEKSYKFALRIVRLYAYLSDEKHERVLSKQVLQDGTQVGAHIKEAQQAEVKSMFIQEMSAALRKASRTEYWLQLLCDGEYLGHKEFESIHADCEELIKMLTAALKTSKARS
jgi:four helix bundle protein